MTLGQAILTRLKEIDSSQARLARRVGISTTEMYNIINGRNFPRPPVLNKILEELNIEMDFKLK